MTGGSVAVRGSRDAVRIVERSVRDARSAREKGRDRTRENPRVERERPLADVAQIALEAASDVRVPAESLDLRHARDPRSHRESIRKTRPAPCELARELGPFR